ncbi:ankyrin repeat protein, partial [Baffinella frigidus]
TALHNAAFGGYEAIVDMLLETAEVNIEANNGLFPFHEAAREGRTAIVQLLMVKGAEIQVRTKKRETPLLLAAREGQNETVQLL